jgi:hypothetical protein
MDRHSLSLLCYYAVASERAHFLLTIKCTHVLNWLFIITLDLRHKSDHKAAWPLKLTIKSYAITFYRKLHETTRAGSMG